jgi:tetratricopeptide (TPR) repeat protein
VGRTVTNGVGQRDVFIVFSKARPGEAKVAIALKDEIEQLALFAFEYEDWSWIESATPHGEADIDRRTLRHMLTTCSVVVLISPHEGDASAGVQVEIDELRACGSPTILLYWSPQGWHPLLDHPALEGLNIIWSYEGKTSGVQDVAQNQCDHIARQLATASWLACQLQSFRKHHANTAARLLDLIPAGPAAPLLNFRLQRDEAESDERGEPGDLEALAGDVVAAAAVNDVTAFVHDWRGGPDLLAESIAGEARFSLVRPVRTFHAACEALCRQACRRFPELADLPGRLLHGRGLMLTRLNRHDEAVEQLQKAVELVPGEERWTAHQSLGLAQQNLDLAAAIASFTCAIECSPMLETTCGLTYNRGALRSEAAAGAAAIEDFTFVVDRSESPTLRHSALRARARERARGGDHDGAIADFTQLLADAQATPRTAVSAWMDRGALYRLQGRHADAIADWTCAIGAADASPEQRFRSLEARARTLEEAGQPLAAAEDYEAMAGYSAMSRENREELLQSVARLRTART